MMGVNPVQALTPETVQQIAHLAAAGCNNTEISRRLSIGRDTVRKYREQGRWDLVESTCADIIRQAYNAYPSNPVVEIEYPCRVVFLDDLHVPFTDWGVVHEVIRREGGADLLITFELLNMDGFSRFDQEYLSNPDAEDQQGAELLDLLLGNFKRVVAGKSNHNDRPIKALLRTLRPEQQQYVVERLRTAVKDLSDKRRNLQLVDSDIVQVGDAVFGHFDRGSITPGTTVQNLASRVNKYADVFGLNPPFRAAYTGHLHRLTMGQVRRHNCYGYEIPASLHLPPYALNHARGGSWSTDFRMETGYGLAVFDADGRIDLTESRAVHLGYADVPEYIKGR